jgi:hypothetical protein
MIQVEEYIWQVNKTTDINYSPDEGVYYIQTFGHDGKVFDEVYKTLKEAHQAVIDMRTDKPDINGCILKQSR